MTDSERAGTVPVVGYAYPWDVIGDPTFADRARGLGVTKVALAAAYHTARAATPLHPEHRFVEARSDIAEIALHAQPDPWATGSSPGLTLTTADDVDLVVSFCWPTTEASVETGRRLVEAVDGRAAAAAYVTVLPPTTEDAFGAHVRALR